MRKSIYLGMVLLLSSTISVSAQATRSLGKAKNAQTTNGVLSIETDEAWVSLDFAEPSVLHVRVTEEQPTTDFSYSVLPYAPLTSMVVAEDPTEWNIYTTEMHVVVSKQPVRITVKNKEGKLVFQNEPAFGTMWNGSECTTYNTLFPDERFIGLGEKTGNLDRRGNGYTNWNTDAYGYTPDTDPLYVSIPFYIGIHDSLCYGVYLDNSSKSHFNFGASNTRFSSFSVEDGEMDYYLISSSSVGEVIEKYTALTGRMPMPAQWSLGFQQCRWSYFPEKEVLQLGQTFRDKEIPLDVLYLDIHYMDAYKIFTWDKNKFPRPAEMISSLREKGIRTTLIIDPGIKVESGYLAYEEGKKEGHFLKYPDGQLFEASVWPGLCHFPDFTAPKARAWWATSFQGYVNDGVTGFWNDMNEPATWGQRFPSNVIFDFDGHPTTTIQGRNMYGMQMARATYEGAKAAMKKRPLVLTRAGFAGIQRYSAVWTGDNTANDEHLLLGCRLVNSLGVSGVAQAGVDVGGFNGDASPALYTRWMTVGAFLPFYRAHKMINMKEAEPWSYGEETEAIVKHYIRLRYRLMPYLYSTFYTAHQTGLPVNRTLAIDFSFDARTFSGAYQNQFMLGDAFLVAPVVSTQNASKVFLPEGDWYCLHSDKKMAGNTEVLVETPLYRLPVFVKAGSIVPQQQNTLSFDDSAGDTLWVHVYKGKGLNEWTYYEDDGESYAYEKGEYLIQRFQYNAEANTIAVEKAENSGSRISKFKHIKFVLHGFSPSALPTINGKKTKFNRRLTTAVFPPELHKAELYYAPLEQLEVYIQE